MPVNKPTPSAKGSNLDLAEIQQIVELMAANNVTLFQLEREDTAITLKRGHDIDGLSELLSKLPSAPAPQMTYAPAPMAAIPVASAPAAAAPTAAAAAEEPVGPAINSPMVGTFYRSSAPGEKSFVNVGDSVDENTTVCIIEAMKVMNEIKAETRGTIARILAEDGKPVQYGQPLFQLK
jgi:acetyl-CoA carboxylase biotin carboxyl carrier protein